MPLAQNSSSSLWPAPATLDAVVARAATIIDLEGKRARASELKFDRGQRCGPYEIVRLVAAGGFGDVYEGVHHLLRRKVAIKILQNRHVNGDELRARLEQEARVLSEIKNPHMVTVFDAGELGGRIWMAMELLEGKTLRDLLESGKPMPVGQALHHAASVANGVAAAHELRVVHRDLKPENIFVTSDGHTVVLDLGTAKVLGDVKGRQTQRVIGTVAYMSPEHLLGGVDGLPIDQRTDVYSLCLILYEMLAGHHPFARNRDTRQMPSSSELARMQIYDLPEPLLDVAPWVPEYLWRIVRSGISKERELRQPTMRDLEIELRQAAKWFVEERAASERASHPSRKALDADTEPGGVPAFVSGEVASSPAERLATKRLATADQKALPHALLETRTSPGAARAAGSPEPPAVSLKASGPRSRGPKAPIPRRVLLAPVAGAVIGLLIVAGVNLAKRRGAAPVSPASSASPSFVAEAPSAAALTATAAPGLASAPSPSAASPHLSSVPSVAPAPVAAAPKHPAAREVAPALGDSPRPINDDSPILDAKPSMYPRPINNDDDSPILGAAPAPKPARPAAPSAPAPKPKASTKLPGSGL